jgi:hypothetical protein
MVCNSKGMSNRKKTLADGKSEPAFCEFFEAYVLGLAMYRTI